MSQDSVEHAKAWASTGRGAIEPDSASIEALRILTRVRSLCHLAVTLTSW